MPKFIPLETRFWSKVSFPRGGTDGCWLWTGTKHIHGYGQFCTSGGHENRTFTHRWSLARSLGRPVVGWVLHSCDTPACVNPAHLREGTPAENVYDAMSRNRLKKPPASTRKGTQVPGSRLTDDKVREIRDRVAGGESRGSVARDIGISPSTISMVVARKHWSHVA